MEIPSGTNGRQILKKILSYNPNRKRNIGYLQLRGDWRTFQERETDNV